MKTLFRSLLVLAFVGLFGVANAQFQIGANFNGVAPLSPKLVTDNVSFGFGGTLVARYGVNDNIRVGLDVGFYSHGEKSNSGLTASFVPISAVFEYSFTTEGFMPYIGAKIGFAPITLTTKTPIGDFKTNGSGFALSPVVGFRYGLSDNIDLDFNIAYQAVLTSGDVKTVLDLTGQSTTISLLPIGLGVVFKLN